MASDVDGFKRLPKILYRRSINGLATSHDGWKANQCPETRCFWIAVGEGNSREGLLFSCPAHIACQEHLVDCLCETRFGDAGLDEHLVCSRRILSLILIVNGNNVPAASYVVLSALCWLPLWGKLYLWLKDNVPLSAYSSNGGVVVQLVQCMHQIPASKFTWQYPIYFETSRTEWFRLKHL